MVRYEIELSSQYRDNFVLDEVTGNLYLRRSLVDETRNQYTVRSITDSYVDRLQLHAFCHGLNAFKQCFCIDCFLLATLIISFASGLSYCMSPLECSLWLKGDTLLK